MPPCLPPSPFLWASGAMGLCRFLGQAGIKFFNYEKKSKRQVNIKFQKKKEKRRKCSNRHHFRLCGVGKLYEVKV
jgi:hypothetical protein